jgi:TRAP-type uncharacterized transport system fused permease subunit
MIKLGVPDFAAHKFIFYTLYYPEVSPPTALSPFAAAAITGGNPYNTTMMAWKYTLPAFLVPFIFTVSPDGIGLLLKGSWGNIIWTGTTAIVGLGALAQDNTLEQALLIAAGLVLVFPGWIKDVIGLCLSFAAVVLQTAAKNLTDKFIGPYC